MSSYGVFAQYYDALTQNVRYAERAGRLHALIEKWQRPDMAEHILLDLACGTGSFSEAFARLGWDVIGADSSAEMLGKALDKKYESGLSVQYLQQDMRRLDLYGTVAVTVCALDSLNHLQSAEDVRAVFSRVNLFSEPGALFLFDVNTAYKHRSILCDNAFVYELPDVFCVWQNALCGKAPGYPVTVRLDFFERLGEGKYRRSTEEFTERIWPQELLAAIMQETGFTLLELLDGDSFDAPTAETQRLLYITRAAGGQKCPENPPQTEAIP